MIVPSFRLYHFAVKLIWKRMLVFTLLFWLGVAGWHLFSIDGRKIDADDNAT